MSGVPREGNGLHIPAMATPLDKPLKRELDLDGTLFTVTLGPTGIKVVQKGKRNGVELTWERILRGDVTLGQELSESLEVSGRVKREE